MHRSKWYGHQPSNIQPNPLLIVESEHTDYFSQFTGLSIIYKISIVYKIKFDYTNFLYSFCFLWKTEKTKKIIYYYKTKNILPTK